MTYLSVENLSKSFGLNTLFKDLTFGISKGDKTALVAPNGTGKSTLLKILAGNETPDSGRVMIQNNVHVGFLEQEPNLDDSLTISEFITQGESKTVQIVRNYEEAVEAQVQEYNEETQQAFEEAAAAMDAADAWDYEQRMEQILSKLDIQQLDQSISSLSGGERKRVALAFVLLDSPDLIILDEPTNHLDVEMIEWLESYLMKANITLLMVTHDRYFLDRVCNHILEIDAGYLYHHNGNYEYYLQKKAERKEIEQTEIAKAGQLLKKEQEWMRRQPKARTTKSKSRIDAFYDTKEKASQKQQDRDLKLETSMTRMGGQVLEMKDVSKSYEDLVILDDFNYSFKKGERIGIIGKNGVGKSTFLNIITGEEPHDSGEIETGQTIVFGHYRQKGIKINENERVIDVMKDIAHVIQMADGSSISASQFLEHFMFTPEMQYTPVSKLSGGEKRRLGLMMVLIKNPNFLILDEPTNDLDLMTLNKLEDFLLGFGGCLILVSHDRFFMDVLVDHYFVFEGEGVVTDHHGTYQEYREQKNREQAELKKEQKEQSKPAQSNKNSKKKDSKSNEGLTFSERKIYQKLEKEIQQLEQEKESIENQLNDGSLSDEEIRDKSEQYGELTELIDEKTINWL
ncbi:MAG: ABC-F family ATP-binding cassette domain-containing protein, partial [Balneolaceae bacterium]